MKSLRAILRKAISQNIVLVLSFNDCSFKIFFNFLRTRTGWIWALYDKFWRSMATIYEIYWGHTKYDYLFRVQAIVRSITNLLRNVL